MSGGAYVTISLMIQLFQQWARAAIETAQLVFADYSYKIFVLPSKFEDKLRPNVAFKKGFHFPPTF